jgi:hypothetical protein
MFRSIEPSADRLRTQRKNAAEDSRRARIPRAPVNPARNRASILLLAVLAACGPFPPPMRETISDAELYDITGQIKAELEDDRCSQLFLIREIRITNVERMRGDGVAEVLEVRGRAVMRLAESSDLNAIGCNTLAIRRRVDAIREIGPGGSSETDVRAYFSQQASKWVIEAADFDD